MSEITISVQGVDRLFAKLGRVQGVKFLRAPMERAVNRLKKSIAKYPAKPPKSKYRRTGNYGRGWETSIDKSAGGLVGKVGIDTGFVPYAPKVGSARFQSANHKRTGWQTDRQVVSQHRSAIVKDFAASIKEALK
jgi:hypothetical protein